MISLHENKTVRLAGLKIETWIAIKLAEQVFDKYHLGTIITAGTEIYDKDGKKIHMIGSLHDTGYAVDLRSKHIPDACWTTFISDLRNVLGVEYQVIIHDTHLHIEFQPPIDRRYPDETH